MPDRMVTYREIVRAVGALNRIAVRIRDDDDADHDSLLKEAARVAQYLSQKLEGK